jgi:hypothetical protein
LQHGREKPTPGLILRPGAIGDAAVNNRQANAGTVDFAVEIGPDLGLEDNHQGGPDGSQDAPHARYVVDGSVENAIDQSGGQTKRGFASGNCTGREIKGNFRLGGAQLPNQGNGGGDLTDRDRMQPDAARLRPSESPGEPTQALSKLRPIAAAKQKARREIDEDKWKCY